MMPDPDQLAAMMAQRERVEHEMARLQLAERAANLAWGAILCSCEHRFTPGRPAWADCLVHGMFVIRPDGTIL
jgi:hypothetical protein